MTREASLEDTYDAGFYDLTGSRAERSAEAIVPFLLSFLRVESVVDVGCGNGAWLRIFQRHGVQDILGIEGHGAMPSNSVIPAENIVVADLTKTYVSNRRFDLAVSLEVAEHLPAEAAPSFVGLLTDLAPVILFSAAIPHQGGVHHVNEQWPDYWEAFFLEQGYTEVDILRSRFWDNPQVAAYYAQNAFLYVREDDSRLPEMREREHQLPKRCIHPATYQRVASPQMSLRALLADVPRAVRRAIASRVSRTARRQPSGESSQ